MIFVAAVITITKVLHYGHRSITLLTTGISPASRGLSCDRRQDVVGLAQQDFLLIGSHGEGLVHVAMRADFVPGGRDMPEEVRACFRIITGHKKGRTDFVPREQVKDPRNPTTRGVPTSGAYANGIEALANLVSCSVPINGYDDNTACAVRPLDFHKRFPFRTCSGTPLLQHWTVQ